LGGIAPITEELTKEPFGQSGDGASVIDMAWRELKCQQLPLIIDNEMEFEAIEPAHRGLAPSSPALEDLVGGKPAIMTDSVVENGVMAI
jgi:hypothetical protein